MVFLFCFLFCSPIFKGEVKNNAEKKIKLSRKKPALGRKNKKTRLDFFQAGRRRFNISVTLLNYCGGYPRARGCGCVFLVSLLIRVPQGDDCGGYPRARRVRKIVHGYPWGDEFPTWSFEVARCVFVYTKDNLCPLYRGGGTYSELVCIEIYIFINLLLYIFILIHLYKYICMCICMYVFLWKNIEDLL